MVNGVKGNVGSFLLSRSSKSIRSKHSLGPQYGRRSHFHFKKGSHFMAKTIGGAPAMGNETRQPQYKRYSGLAGDVRRKPDYDHSFDDRQDGVMYEWKKRGKLQLHQMKGRPETFVCFRCGYPVRSRLVATKRDNWDHRMCYNCYCRVVGDNEEDTI